MRPGAAAARRTIATTRLAVLRTGDALLGYGGLTQALWRNKEDGSQLVLVAVEADDSPDTLFDGLSDASLMAAADAVLEGYGEDVAPTAEDARIGAARPAHRARDDAGRPRRVGDRAPRRRRRSHPPFHI